jgi:hypothetical protein
MTALNAPFLSPSVVQQVVAERLSKHRRALVALYGTGEAQIVTVAQRGDVEVIPVRSEFELRTVMPDLVDSAPRAFLVPWQGTLPDDLAGRFINSGRIERVDRGAQVAALLGATRAEDETARLVLATYLLRAGNPKPRYSSASQVVSSNTLYEVWLREDWNVPTEGGLAADALLAWAATSARYEEFLAALKDAPEGLHAELETHLSETVGPVALKIWKGWERGQGARLLAFAVLCEALADTDDANARAWLRQKARLIVDLDPRDDVSLFTQTLGRLVRPAFAWLANRDSTIVPRTLRLAEELVDDPDVKPQLIASARLPIAWSLRLAALSDQLEALAAKPTRGTLALVERAWRELERHTLWQEDKTRFVEAVEMAVRLGAWLTLYATAPLEPATSNYGDVDTLGSWYAQEGGFVDWARRRARSLQGSPVTPGAQAVVSAADRLRETLDTRFASALEQWVHAGRPSQNVLPIESVLKRVAARFLEQAPDRTLLVLLMDGMAWAQAVELLPSLASGGRCWGPIAWHNLSPNRVGVGANPTMVAALPTITSVSRAAFFGGKLIKPGDALDTSKDTERFANNKVLHPFCDDGVKPRLLLRGDGHTADGALSQEALHLISATKEQRVVGLVVNAIDASLKGDTQQEHRWDVESIRSLPQIFDAAMNAGRHVLIAADHGHVPADRLKSVGAGDSGGARWRVWRGTSDALQPGERKFSGEGVYVPRGYEGVVLLDHDGLRYGGGAHAGEHGGAALAEIVAPCLLLGYDDPTRTPQDPALAVRGLPIPEWWTRSLPEVVGPTLTHDEPAPRKTPKKASVSEKQLGLQGIATGNEVVAPGSTPPPSNKSQEKLPTLWNSEVLKVRTSDAAMKAKTVVAVHFLLQRPGGAPAAAFASHLEEAPFRIGGLISKLQEILNVDGYEILRFDRTNQQVFLDKPKLEQQFQIKL